MKQIKAICILMAAIYTMASCVSDSDDTTLYDEAAITSFVLGTVNKYTVTDSTITKTTFTGSNYKFVIDQMNHKIYNPDSLPYGSDPEHIICTISTVNNSVATYKGIGTDDSELYYYYSSTDSIDFSVPRLFRIYSSDGTGYTDYNITVNVHQEQDEPLSWKVIKHDDTLAKMTALKALYYDGKFYIFGVIDNATKIYSTTDGQNFQLLNSSIALSASAYKSVKFLYDSFYLFDNDKLYFSTDAITWNERKFTTSKALKQLIGASTYDLYALSTENTIMRSKDYGETWEEEYLDTDAEFLPTRDIEMISYPVRMADNTEYIMMVGNRDNVAYGDVYSVVWHKYDDYDDATNSGLWTYMDRGGKNTYSLKSCKNINLLRYENSILAFTGTSYVDEDYKPYKTILQSRDNGITWKENNYYPMPTFEETPKWASAVVDDDAFIWIFCAGGKGDVVRSRLNRVAWTNK